jgi:hypothetical protein
MSFSKVPNTSFKSDTLNTQPIRRPRFDSKLTSDRLRESSTSFSMASNISKGRKSIFKEMGLSDDESERSYNPQEFSDEKEFGEIAGLSSEPRSSIGTRADDEADESKKKSRWLSMLSSAARPKIKSAASAPPATVSSVQRMSMIALIIAIVIPAISYKNGWQKVEMNGADAGVIREPQGIVLEDRADSPVTVCKRWAHQCE